VVIEDDKMEVKEEFKTLIDTLSKKKLLNESHVKLLGNLEVHAYSDIIEILRSQGNKQTLLVLTKAIGLSRFVAHSFDWTNVTSVIVNLLDSPDWEIRLEAAWTLGYVDATDTLDALAKVAVVDENDGVREIAIYAISQWRLPRSAPYLIPIVLDQHQPPRIRETAIEALGESESSEALPVLGRLLQDENVDIRDFAVLALHNTQDPNAIPYLKTVLSDQAVSRFGETIAEQAQRTIDYLTKRAAELHDHLE